MYTGIAGINTTANLTHTGWKHIVFRPIPAALEIVGSASASVVTRFGIASIEWQTAQVSQLGLVLKIVMWTKIATEFLL